MRLLIVSHGHPAFYPGGGELLAHRLYQTLRRNGHEAFFVGFVYPELLTGGNTQTVFAPNRRDPNDLAVRGGSAFDFFMGRHGDLRLTEVFARILETVAPDIVHFHHFLLAGLESFRTVKNLRPSCKIVMTLHEYWAICAYNGQMVRANGALCHESSLYACAACLPDRTPAQFFLREQWLKSFLVLVDRFIGPSRFLLDRYQTWGLPSAKLEFIANGASCEVGDSDPARPEGRERFTRFGFFGQLTRVKGVEILLQAARRLHEQGVDFQLGLHGPLPLQDPAHQKHLQTLFADAEGYATYFGPYPPQEAVALMAEYDWIVIPSTWWENAPLVVEEALAARRPLICSDIGGLKEKVIHGRDGLHFRAGDPGHLTETLMRATTPDWQPKLQATLRQPVSLEECAAQHRALYQSLLDE